jgi:glycosyltransferase involved in cell wall biosynthesis
MRVLLFEPDNQGHRLTYVRYVAEALLAAGCEVVLTTADYVPPSIEFKTQLSHLLPRIKVDPWITPGCSNFKGPLKGFRHTAFLVEESIRRNQPDHVIVVMADGVSQALGVFPRSIPKGLEIEGLFMRGRWAYKSNSLKQKIRTLVSTSLTQRAPWTRLLHLDEFAVEALKRRGGRIARISQLMPHAIEPPANLSRRQARAILGLDPDAIFFSAIGVLDRRKGIDVLLQAFQHPDCPAAAKLFLVGKPSGEIVKLFDSAPIKDLRNANRLFIIDRYVSDQEMAAAFAASDCVVTLYTDTTVPASILLHAASYAKPVLGSDEGWIGQMIRKF